MSQKVLIPHTCTLDKLFVETMEEKIASRLNLGQSPFANEEEKWQCYYHIASCARCYSAVKDMPGNYPNLASGLNGEPKIVFNNLLHMLVNILLEKGEMPKHILDEYGGVKPSGFSSDELEEYRSNEGNSEVCQQYKAIIKNGWRLPEDFKLQEKNEQDRTKNSALAATR